MTKTLVKTYKTPLLVSLTLGIVLVAVRSASNPLEIATIFLACSLGTFLLDLDYIIYAFFLEPRQEFSRTLAAFIRHGDIKNTFSYIHYHKNDIDQKTLNSALFQTVLAGVAVFIISSNTSLFLKALILSAYANSFYRLAETFYESQSYREWFWALKSPPTKNGVKFYLLVLAGVFIYCLRLV